MQKLQMLLTSMLIVSIAAFTWVYAQGSNDPNMMSGEDLAEIQHLYSQYNQGTDFLNADRWLNVFTEDAIFRIGDNGAEWAGRDAMREYRSGSFATRSEGYTYRHWNSSWVVTPDGEGRATGRVYWMGFDPSTEPLTIQDTGYYDDIYVKTAKGWRIKQRHAHPDPASPGGGSNSPGVPPGTRR